MRHTYFSVALVLIVAGVAIFAPPTIAAHCDTLGGPVITTAQLALKTSDVTPVLKWVKPEYEDQVRSAFARAVRVRSQGPEAQELADTYFFETLVRLHRAGEGALYSGLRSEPVEPEIAATDQALETNSAEALVKMLNQEITLSLGQKFVRAAEAKRHAGDSVVAGREYVAAYVELTHYVEGLHKAAVGGSHDVQKQTDTHGGR